jgi:hypothetical protein
LVSTNALIVLNFRIVGNAEKNSPYCSRNLESILHPQQPQFLFAPQTLRNPHAPQVACLARSRDPCVGGTWILAAALTRTSHFGSHIEDERLLVGPPETSQPRPAGNHAPQKIAPREKLRSAGN